MVSAEAKPGNGRAAGLGNRVGDWNHRRAGPRRSRKQAPWLNQIAANWLRSSVTTALQDCSRNGDDCALIGRARPRNVRRKTNRRTSEKSNALVIRNPSFRLDMLQDPYIECSGQLLFVVIDVMQITAWWSVVKNNDR